MSVIVRGFWSPPSGPGYVGWYGHLGREHPTIPGYVWVTWLPNEDRPLSAVAGGYYSRTHLTTIGTAFIE